MATIVVGTTIAYTSMLICVVYRLHLPTCVGTLSYPLFITTRKLNILFTLQYSYRFDKRAVITMLYCLARCMQNVVNIRWMYTCKM